MIRIIPFLFAFPAFAHEVPCGPPDLATARLIEQYGESSPVEGDGPLPGHVTAWWGNPATGTWTVVMILPNGTICFVLSGQGQRAPVPVPPGELN